MNWLVQNFGGMFAARIKAATNSASLIAGGWVMSHMLDWFGAHATYVSHADAMAIAGTVATCAAGLVMTVGSSIYNVWFDPNNVNAKVIVAAATGDTTAANDSSIIKQVKDVAGTPAALNDLVAKLQAGQV
jgi:hypothetical protein